MAGVNTLSEVYKQKGDKFIKDLLNKFVIINTQNRGTHLGLTVKDKFPIFYKKSGPISIIDRILTKLYEKPIKYLENKILNEGLEIPEDLYIGMQFIKNSGSDHKLSVSYIKDIKSNTVYHKKEDLDPIADKLGISRSPILYQGRLDDIQKKNILDFIYTPYENLIKTYKTLSFTEYILDLLNVNDSKSIDIDSIVFRFYEDDDLDKTEKAFLTKLVDPIILDITKGNKEESKPNDYIYLILIDLMNFIESYRVVDLKSMIDQDSDYDKNYIKIMNQVFKDFVKEFAMKYLDIKIDIPEFLKDPNFDINMDLINDDDVISYIELNPIFKEIYKILINFFRRKKKNAVGIFNTEVLLQFNSLVDKIKSIIIGKPVYEGVFPNYNEFTTSISEEFNIITGIDVKDTYKKIKKLIPVNIIIDHFQPITLEHIRSAELLKKKNNKPCVLIVLHEDYKNRKHPFKYSTIKKLNDHVKAEYPELIKEVLYINQSNIESIINSLYPKYQPILWGTHKNKINDYALQLDYAKRKNIKYNLKRDMKLIEIPILNNQESLFSSIESGAIKVFQSLTPSSIHSQFFNLQKELENRNK